MVWPPKWFECPGPWANSKSHLPGGRTCLTPTSTNATQVPQDGCWTMLDPWSDSSGGQPIWIWPLFFQVWIYNPTNPQGKYRNWKRERERERDNNTIGRSWLAECSLPCWFCYNLSFMWSLLHQLCAWLTGQLFGENRWVLLLLVDGSWNIMNPLVPHPADFRPEPLYSSSAVGLQRFRGSNSKWPQPAD